jgi:hypothetical protein
MTKERARFIRIPDPNLPAGDVINPHLQQILDLKAIKDEKYRTAQQQADAQQKQLDAAYAPLVEAYAGVCHVLMQTPMGPVELHRCLKANYRTGCSFQFMPLGILYSWDVSFQNPLHVIYRYCSRFMPEDAWLQAFYNMVAGNMDDKQTLPGPPRDQGPQWPVNQSTFPP